MPQKGLWMRCPSKFGFVLSNLTLRKLEGSVGLRACLTLFCAAILSFGHQEDLGVNKSGFVLKLIMNLEGSAGLRVFQTLFCAALLSLGWEEDFGMNKFGFALTAIS